MFAQESLPTLYQVLESSYTRRKKERKGVSETLVIRSRTGPDRTTFQPNGTDHNSPITKEEEMIASLQNITLWC